MHFHSRSFVDLVVSLLECCAAISGVLKFFHWLQLHARFTLISSCILAEANDYEMVEGPFTVWTARLYYAVSPHDPMTEIVVQEESRVTKLLILALEFLIQSLELRVHFVLGVGGRLTGRACSRRSTYPAFAELGGHLPAKIHKSTPFNNFIT